MANSIPSFSPNNLRFQETELLRKQEKERGYLKPNSNQKQQRF